MKDRTEIIKIALPLALEVVAVSLSIMTLFVWICILGTGGV